MIGEHTGDRYRICWGTSQNIIKLVISEGHERAVERLCFGPRGVPIGDILLHQKIALEGDEQAALRIAGRAPVPDRRVSNYAVSMGPDGPVHVDSNGQPAQVGMQADYAAPYHGQVGQQRLQVRLPEDGSGGFIGRAPDPDRASGFGWNVASQPDREEF